MTALTGEYRTNRGTQLNLQVVGNELTGDAMTINRPSDAERVTLRPQADGSFTGTMRVPTQQAMAEWYNLTLRFAADGSSFTAEGRHANTPTAAPITYSGERAGRPSAAAKGSSAGGGGFADTGYLHMKVDHVARSTVYDVDRIAVTFTVRSEADTRRGVQHSDRRLLLVTSDGAELRTDGNHYGQSSDERLYQTLFLEKGQEGVVTYVFPGIRATATPLRLVVKNGNQQVASFDLPALTETP